MLSYRHAFHAGNAADVLKHLVLIFCLDYLGQKEKPYLCVDTHAGAGAYSLTGGYAAQNREWEGGIGRLAGTGKGPLPGMISRYREIVLGDPAGTTPLITWYPGSPAIIGKLLRSRDRAACFEPHPADFLILRNLLGGDPRFILRREDGFAALKALLPPPTRRGCVFIDPSYEVKDDYKTLPEVLREALRRFPQGIYIIWYPLLDRREALPLPEILRGLHRGTRCGIEIRGKNPPARGLGGSGLVIYNPPWTLREALETSLPALAPLLDCTWTIWSPPAINSPLRNPP
jgi:23S rRNA (adenine2030-N6)-methyltransferase